MKVLCKANTGRTPKTMKAREIASHFAQGRQYFQSAEAAGALVRPLILDYGTMALARGLVLFLDPGLSKVAAGHGLGADGWADLNAQPDAIPDLAVAVHANGTFPEFARVTKNADRTRIPAEDNPFEIAVESPGPSPLPAGTSVTVREIVAQIPDVRGVYERTFGEHGGRVRCEVLAVNHISGRNHEGFAWVGVVQTRAGLPDQQRVADGAFEGVPDVAGASRRLPVLRPRPGPERPALPLQYQLRPRTRLVRRDRAPCGQGRRRRALPEAAHRRRGRSLRPALALPGLIRLGHAGALPPGLLGPRSPGTARATGWGRSSRR
ncbi:MAG: hypothetical protein M3Q49_06890 [Actinomycetota bacterium]|nr:hypothetical protein [Actinomycetota bacterium]